MLAIVETSNREVAFLLQPRNYTLLYSKLKTILTKEEVSLFCRPDVFSEFTQWSSELDESYPNISINNFDDLSAGEKDEAASVLEIRKAAVLQKLSDNTDFKPVMGELLIVPSSGDIKILRAGTALIPVLTQWGCKSYTTSTTIDPVSIIINQERLARAMVLIEIFYTDGSAASEKEFYLEQYGREAIEETDLKGVYNRGLCKIDSVFSVYLRLDNEKIFVHEFVIKSGGNYKVIFPYLTDIAIRVIDQSGRIAANWSVLFKYKGIQQELNTDQEGNIFLNNREAWEEITIGEKGNELNSHIYRLEKTDNEYTLQITLPVLATARIKVVDRATNELQNNYAVLVEYEDRVTEYNTGMGGFIQIDGLMAGKKLKITPKYMPAEPAWFELIEGENDLLIYITKPEAKFVKIKLIDHRRKPQPNVPIDFTYNGKTCRETTDADGVCILPHESFVDGEKVKVNILLPKNSKKK